MRVRHELERLVRTATRRPAVTLAVVIVLALGGGALALGMRPSTGTDTFVARSSGNYRVTADDQQHFGGDPVIVMIHEPLADLVLTKELATETQLEACLAGQTVVANASLSAFTPAPAGSGHPYGGWSSPCGQLMRMQPAQVVYGPGTFLNRSVSAVNSEVVALEHQAQAQALAAARATYAQALHGGASAKQALTAAQAAAAAKSQQAYTQLAMMALDSGVSSLPRIDSTDFISQIVFDPTRGSYQPKARFAYLFPTADSALVQVRLKASLSAAQQARAIALIRQAVKMPRFASAYGGTYTVSGAPVVLDDLASRLTRSIAVLLAAAVAVMALALALVFRSPRRPARHGASLGRAGGESPRWLRLLPLGVALSAAGITFGLSAVLGASLTMASIAVLPILIGLAVDYAVQFQSRVDEARGAAAGAHREAVVTGALAGAPTIAVAALATAVGFLVLLLSPVPMVRGFGELLVLGIAVALLCALSAGSAAMVLAGRAGGSEARPPRALARALIGAGELVGIALTPPRRGARVFGRAATRGARGFGHAAMWALRAVISPLTRRRIAGGRLRRASAAATAAGRRPGAALMAAPWPILAVGVLLAAAGWVADTQTPVQSDVTKLVPANMRALHDLRQLERVTGVSGEIDVVVHGRDVATPQTLGWMIRYEQSLFDHYGYAESRGCAASTVCPALSLPDLFAAGSQAPQSVAGTLTQASINSLLSAVPEYFRQAVITPDRREATLAFGIRLMPLGRQQQVIDYMRSHLLPPAGVHAALAGLPVLAAQANVALSSSARRLGTLLAGLLAVGLALAVVLRQPRRVLVPLVPIALATGWSALILYAVGVPLNPMSATLGALVIAISTEFSVLLSERYRQERRAGLESVAALRRTYGSTGAAVLVSGLTAIAGFGVLVVSDITMLREFGFVTLIDLTVSLAGVLVMLPAVLAVSERGRPLPAAAAWLRGAVAGLPRPRRRARVA